jgi:hypothetical protein
MAAWKAWKSFLEKGPGLRIGLAPTYGLASLGLEIDIFSDILYSILLHNAILGLDFLGLALSAGKARSTRQKPWRPRPPRWRRCCGCQQTTY